jgi:4'-phosphopantetheinyl transferase
MDLYWLEQTESDVPPSNDWLGPQEAACLAAMRFLNRRSDWRLGRWTAKQALATCLNLSTNLPDLANLEIRAASSGAPEVFIDSQLAGIAISLSHRAGTAMCTVGALSSNFGCDLEMVEARSPAFVKDYFTADEQALIADISLPERSLLLALLWSAKESALKALRVGLRLDTRCMSVKPSRVSHALDADLTVWHPLSIRYSSTQTFSGWWRLETDLVRTVVSDVLLQVPLPAREGSFVGVTLRQETA